MALRGIDYLKNKLNSKRVRVEQRYRFYEMKALNIESSPIIPANIQAFYKSTMGWCAKAVDSLADRLSFREFDNDNFELNEIFQLNNPDVLFDSAILSALIASCAFIHIARDEDGYPRLEVIDAGNATGIIDPITGLLREGYAVLEHDEFGIAKKEIYLIPGETVYYEEGNLKGGYRNASEYPLLVPVINRPDAMRDFGHSRISRAAMYYQRYAMRTMERSEVSAEFYSFPQKYVVGLSDEAEQLETWKATISSMLRFDKDSDGDKPQLGQFQQQSMSPFTEQIRTAAAMFAGETGLTLDDLGFVSDNPTSAEAIKASHETLRVIARKCQKTFGSGFLNVGFLAACVRDDFAYQRKQFYLTHPVWEPIFEPDAAAMSLIGDGAIKINQAVPGYVDKKTLRALTGIEGGNG